MRYLICVLGFLLLFVFASDAHAKKVASTRQDPNTNFVEFMFDDEPSVRIAPLGNDDAGVGCLAKEEGGLRYNKKTTTMEYCDGLKWTDMKPCPSGQFAMRGPSGGRMCIPVACPKGQMLSKEVSGTLSCVNIAANMDCVVAHPYAVTGWSIAYQCADNRLMVSAACARNNRTSKPPSYDNWQNGLFTGSGMSSMNEFGCVFENGNDPTNPNRWPNMGVEGTVLCCK